MASIVAREGEIAMSDVTGTGVDAVTESSSSHPGVQMRGGSWSEPFNVTGAFLRAWPCQ